MARPTKQGIDYFPLDVEWDQKHELYALETEAEGIGILITIWQMIYKNEGYYIPNGKDLLLVIKKRTSKPIDLIQECITKAIDRGVFNEDIHDKFNVLTSKALQKRFFTAAKQKKVIYYDPKFVLVDVSIYDNLVSINVNPLKSHGNATNVEVEVEEEVEEEENVYSRLYAIWNSQNIVVHKKLTGKIESKIKATLKEYTDTEITDAILRYGSIVSDKKYYFTFKWTLVDFLQRGISKFDSDVCFNNYLEKIIKSNPDDNIMSEAGRQTYLNGLEAIRKIEEEGNGKK